MTPTVASQIGEYVIKLTQVRTADGVTTTYDSMIVKVDCIIETFIPPTVPDEEKRIYTIFNDL